MQHCRKPFPFQRLSAKCIYTPFVSSCLCLLQSCFVNVEAVQLNIKLYVRISSVSYIHSYQCGVLVYSWLVCFQIHFKLPLNWGNKSPYANFVLVPCKAFDVQNYLLYQVVHLCFYSNLKNIVVCCWKIVMPVPWLFNVSCVWHWINNSFRQPVTLVLKCHVTLVITLKCTMFVMDNVTCCTQLNIAPLMYTRLYANEPNLHIGYQYKWMQKCNYFMDKHKCQGWW